MNDLPSLHPKRLKWRLEWLGQVCVEWVIARLPGAVVFRVGEWFGGVLWHVMGLRRRIVLKNLRIVYGGEKSFEEIRKLARESFRRSIANLFSAVHTAQVKFEELERSVTLENTELGKEVTSLGRGVLILPPHMGNWEVLSRMNRLYAQGLKTGAFYRPLNNPYLDERLARKRMSEGMRLFAKKDSMHVLGGFLRGGGMLGILADQRTGLQGQVSQFFGRLTRSSPLPSLLIRRCKCEAVAISLKTVSPGRWVGKYHEVGEAGDTAACMDAIERAMRESPVDVFWFHDRWKTYVWPEYTIRDWLGDDNVRSERQGHRALVWLVGCEEGWRVPEGWQHGDVRYEYVVEEGVVLPEWVPGDAVVHRVSGDGGVSRIRGEIARIDGADIFPVDYILTGSGEKSLRKASKREGMQLVSLAV